MAQTEQTFVTRARIAELAGVKRPAVTNWARRHTDFPSPVPGENDVERFRVADVAAWLSLRTIPQNALRSDERRGTTYGDRFRGGLSAGANGREVLPAEEIVRRMTRAFDAWRGELARPDDIELLLTLFYLRSARLQAWSDLLDSARSSLTPRRALEDLVSQTPLADAPEGVLARTGESTWEQPGIWRLIDAVDESLRAADGTVDPSNAPQAFQDLLTAVDVSDEAPTPPSIVDLMVRMLMDRDREQRVGDPYSRVGEFLVAAAAHGTPERTSLGGRTPSPRSYSIAAMNLDLHQMESELFARTGTFIADERDGWRGRFDVLLTNPPFNLRISEEYPLDMAMLPYGPPPKRNANFLWLQHALTMLREGGRAGVLMGNNACFSSNSRDHHIRRAMVEDGAIECLVALPSQLFRHTGIPVTLWILRAPIGSCDEILFIDARDLGVMESRTRRILREEDSENIRYTYTDWLHQRVHRTSSFDVEGFSRSVPIGEIRERDYALTPPSYIRPSCGRVDMRDELRALSDLRSELTRLHDHRREVDAGANRVLEEIDRWTH